MSDPKRRKVQLKAKPMAFQYGPSKPSSTSNHCKKNEIRPKFSTVKKKVVSFFVCFHFSFWSNLNDMVFEADILFLFSAPVLDVQNANQISSPTSHYSVEDLEYDARKHSQLSERVWQC